MSKILNSEVVRDWTTTEQKEWSAMSSRHLFILGDPKTERTMGCWVQYKSDGKLAYPDEPAHTFEVRKVATWSWQKVVSS